MRKYSTTLKQHFLDPVDVSKLITKLPILKVASQCNGEHLPITSLNSDANNYY
jgi:hypothetical protein